MSRLLRILLVFLILAVPFVARCQPTGSPAGGIERRIDSLMAKMTLEEKIGQLTQYSPTRAERREVCAFACTTGTGARGKSRELPECYRRHAHP